MWLFYLLLAIAATAQAGNRRHEGRLQRSPSPQAFINQNAIKRQNTVKRQNMTIAGTGTIDSNGKTSLKINVNITGRLFPVFPEFPGASGPQPTLAPTSTEEPTSKEKPTSTVRPTGAPAGGVGAPGAFTEEEQSGLVAHNNFRRIHQAPAMTLDRKMCDAAKAYAQRLANMGTLMHSPSFERSGQGENLSMGCSTDAAQTVEQAVTNWYNEVCDPGYDFSAGGFSGGTGHFTQVVWKESTVLGIGRAESTRGSMKCAYIVGRYKPAGNMMGSFPENVKKGSFNRNYCTSIAKMTRYFDINGGTVNTGTPFTQVDVPDIPGKKASEGIVFLKKKKRFVD